MTSIIKDIHSKANNKVTINEKNSINNIFTKKCLLILTNYNDGIDAMDYYRIHWYLTKKHLTVEIATKFGGIVKINNLNVESNETHQQYIQSNSPVTSISFDNVNPLLYDCLIIPSCEGCLVELANNERLGYIIHELYHSNKIICAIGYGVAGLLSAKSTVFNSSSNNVTTDWIFNERSLTGATIKETYDTFYTKDLCSDYLIFVENQIRFEGGNFISTDRPSIPHIVIDGKLITGQNTHSYDLILKIVIQLLKTSI